MIIITTTITKDTEQVQELTVIHLHLNATSRTVLSRSEAAILMYFIILGSLANLSSKQCDCHTCAQEVKR